MRETKIKWQKKISLELNALCDFQFGWTKTFMCVRDSSPHVGRISHSSLFGLHAATFLWSCYDAASTVTFLVKSFFCHCWWILAKLGKLGRKLQKEREMMWDVRPHAARRPWVIFYTSIDLRQCLLGDFTEALFLQLVHLIAPQRKIALWSGSERSLKLPIWLKSCSWPQKVFQVLSICAMHQAGCLVHSRPARSL